jgi:hypothetical protein
VFEPLGVHRRQRAGGGRLLGQELVVRPRDGGDIDPAAEEARAGELALCRLHLDQLARVALDVGIGDVVAGDLQAGIVGRHGLHAQ